MALPLNWILSKIISEATIRIIGLQFFLLQWIYSYRSNDGTLKRSRMVRATRILKRGVQCASVIKHAKRACLGNQRGMPAYNFLLDFRGPSEIVSVG